MAKDQNRDIAEWVYYHHWLGCENIYVYDNNSTTPLSHELHDWIRSGAVIYTRFAGSHLNGVNRSFRTTGEQNPLCPASYTRHTLLAQTCHGAQVLVQHGPCTDCLPFHQPQHKGMPTTTC